MNKYKYELYLKGLSNGWLDKRGYVVKGSNAPFTFIMDITIIDMNTKTSERPETEEFKAALEIYNSPLMKALT